MKIGVLGNLAIVGCAPVERYAMAISSRRKHPMKKLSSFGWAWKSAAHGRGNLTSNIFSRTAGRVNNSSYNLPTGKGQLSAGQRMVVSKRLQLLKEALPLATSLANNLPRYVSLQPHYNLVERPVAPILVRCARIPAARDRSRILRHVVDQVTASRDESGISR